MSTGGYPFEGDTIFLLFENIGRGVFTIPPSIDTDLANLLRGMLAHDPHHRLDIPQIKLHRLLESYFSAITSFVNLIHLLIPAG